MANLGEERRDGVAACAGLPSGRSSPVPPERRKLFDARKFRIPRQRIFSRDPRPTLANSVDRLPKTGWGRVKRPPDSTPFLAEGRPRRPWPL